MAAERPGSRWARRAGDRGEPAGGGRGQGRQSIGQSLSESKTKRHDTVRRDCIVDDFIIAFCFPLGLGSIEMKLKEKKFQNPGEGEIRTEGKKKITIDGGDNKIGK